MRAKMHIIIYRENVPRYAQTKFPELHYSYFNISDICIGQAINAQLMWYFILFVKKLSYLKLSHLQLMAF